MFFSIRKPSLLHSCWKSMVAMHFLVLQKVCLSPKSPQATLGATKDKNSHSTVVVVIHFLRNADDCAQFNNHLSMGDQMCCYCLVSFSWAAFTYLYYCNAIKEMATNTKVSWGVRSAQGSVFNFMPHFPAKSLNCLPAQKYAILYIVYTTIRYKSLKSNRNKNNAWDSLDIRWVIRPSPFVILVTILETSATFLEGNLVVKKGKYCIELPLFFRTC